MSTHQEDVILPPITFTANGPSEEVRIANLEAVLPSPGYPVAATLLADALVKRADIVVLDYNRDAVQVRYQIDGIWHNLPMRDRQSGDYMLATLKKLADLNYQERRARQEGEFKVQFRGKKSVCHFTSQGVQTGERVALRINRPKPPLLKLEELGMRPKMRDKLLEYMSAKTGMVLFCSLPGDGLSTLWHAALSACDRLMRDYFTFEPEKKPEPEIINIEPIRYKADSGDTPLNYLPDLMLREPDVLCFTELMNAEVINRMTDLVLKENKLVFTRVHAKSAVEALLRVLVHRCDLKKFAQSIRCVVNTRLVRRLCENCKQPFTPAPQLLQKLGIPVGRVGAFYAKYLPPPPEQLVDEKGNPIPPPVCEVCGNLGFVERIGIFEMLEVDDAIRDAVIASPDLESLTKAAKDSGFLSLREEGIAVVAKGLTSIDELQRVLQK